MAAAVAACSVAAPAPEPIAAPAPAAAPRPGLAADRFPKPERPVAGIISDQWMNEDSRERAGEAAKVMDLLGVRPGIAVADIGAGAGYYVGRLSRRVGPAGQVIAQDIERKYLDRLRQRVSREGLANVTLVLGEAHDPRLPPRSVDLALLVHMYHEIAQPFGLLHNLAPAMRPGGGWRSSTRTAPSGRTARPARCSPASSPPSATARRRGIGSRAARSTSPCSSRRPSSRNRSASSPAACGR